MGSTMSGFAEKQSICILANGDEINEMASILQCIFNVKKLTGFIADENF